MTPTSPQHAQMYSANAERTEDGRLQGGFVLPADGMSVLCSGS